MSSCVVLVPNLHILGDGSTHVALRSPVGVHIGEEGGEYVTVIHNTAVFQLQSDFNAEGKQEEVNLMIQSDKSGRISQ